MIWYIIGIFVAFILGWLICSLCVIGQDRDWGE